MWIYVLSSGLCVCLGGIWWWWRSKNSFHMPGKPRDTVVLHTFGPAPYAPSISAFVIKIEMYLRVANIPYVYEPDKKVGPKGKIPWMQYNDDVIADTHFMIDYLNKKYRVDLNKKLTDEQRSVGHIVMRMVEEWLYWIAIMKRVIYDKNGTIFRKLGIPSPIIWFMRTVMRPKAWSQGIGRHSEPEVTTMLNQDLAALQTILGSKNYLFGETPSDVTEYDCALFGQLCQLTWQLPNTGVEELIQEKYPTLAAYCERMRAAFWSDWDTLLMK